MNNRLLRLAVANVKRDWGRVAFSRMGDQIQEALVAREFLSLLAMQDESVPDNTVRTLIQAGWGEINDVEDWGAV